tara:strand:- start:219 stop:410 length:192 start_codon:yes stop_codon:yes gene_type:complete
MINQEQIKKYNELIKLSIKTMSVLKGGNYEMKSIHIENCKKDIKFFKMMKNKLSIENKELEKG